MSVAVEQPARDPNHASVHGRATMADSMSPLTATGHADAPLSPPLRASEAVEQPARGQCHVDP